ncbi:MAG: DUF2141 domain-containing protein [Proteobacteria bacterium]|nr:DUF2141 domain-containing protein [Pseudomonadota bacterium]
MRKALIIGILFVLPFGLSAAEISFVMKNLESNDGSVRVAVFGSAETFLEKGKAVVGCKTQKPLKNRQARVICQLKPGRYAAAVFHDENDNKKMDQNFFKIPKEGYGFSNNAKGSFGPPKYEDAAFSVGEEDMAVEILLNY